MRRAATLFATTALAATTLVATPASAAPATITQVPYPIDSSNQAAWWSPLDTYNAYAYLAFNEPGSQAGTHKVAIARRDGAGAWTKLPVMNGSAQAEYTDDDGHNQPSVARDGSGRFHVFASMHNNAWRYFRSDTVGGNPTLHSADLPDQGVGVTYPVLSTAPNGDLYLIARLDGAQSAGRSGRLYRWNDAASTWTRVAVFAESANRAVYPDDLQFDTAGNLHILWEWGLWPATAFRHQLSYLVYHPATGAFTDHSGASVTVPVSTSTADVIQPVEAGEVYQGNDGTGPAVQSAKLTLDGTSPKVAYRYRKNDVFTVRYAYTNGTWLRETVFDQAQTSAAIDITWAGDGKRVYYTTATGGMYVATKPGTAWTAAAVAPGLPVTRFAVERSSTQGDVLYLVDLTNLRLYYGRN
ncbi:BNR-4 repeat-containing protein [Dactylosporangium sp. CA-052675]|uniref:BNR-4 repeat-containing protein n=1 Tax=Dactylosporangium sp. CA-052675 TaxID=3239927 RepID=UPI003D922AE9